MMAFLEVGQRVVRSATWSWKNQDGGEGHLGTVVMLTDQDPVIVPNGWARVRWDNGYCNNYQVGSTRGNYDLLLFDNAPAGVVHPGIVCAGCEVDPIAGMRWKCCDQSCPDYNLCTPCYMNDKHDLTHKFTRFSSHRETGTQVAPRLGEDTTISRGLCPEAEVSRGEDWQGGAEHDDSGGTVLEACAISERPRSGVTVRWTKSKSVTTHRVGYDGKVDLKYTKPGAGTTYYSRHLPVLGEEVGLKVGDHVTITMEIDKLQEMQQMAGCEWSPRMKNLLAKVGKVTGINSDGNVEIVYPGRETNFLFHPDVLNKVPVLAKGDLVRVNATLNNVKYLQENSKNGWLDDMEECLGREGTVVLVDSHFSAAVRLVGVEGDVWWHPGSLTLVKRKQSTSTDDDTESIGVNAELGNTLEDEQGADDDGTQFVRAAEIGDLRRVLKILSSSPEKVNVKVRGKTALHKASVHGHLEVVKALIEAGAEIHVESTGKGKTPLHYAVEGDEPAVTKYLTEKGADVNRRSAEQRRPIHIAAYGNFVDCARILISHGCDVNVQDTSQDTPLHDAILKNSIDVAAMLLNVPNIDTTLTNKKEMTPMQYTALIDRPEIAGLIAQNYPESLCIRRQSGHTILHIAAVNNHVEVMKVVLAVKGHGLCLDTENDQGLTALHLAALKGFSQSTEFLVSQGANVNIQSKYGHSPLHLLAKAVRKNPTKTKETSELKKIQRQYRDRGVSNNAAALLCFMVLHGACIDAEDVKCRTPLYHIEDPKLKKTLKQIAQGERVDDETTREDVEEDQDAEMENLMMSSNAIRDEDIPVERNDIVCQDPDSPKHYKYDFDGKANWSDHQIRNPSNSNKPKLEELDNSPEGEMSEDDEGSQFIRAAKIGDLGRVLEILSSSPEKVNVKVQDQTALHKASISGHLEVVKALIEAGADIEGTTSAGHTPLHYSVEGDEPVITKYLIEKGADVNRGSARQRTAIHRAAYGNAVDCARILIEHGCDVNVQDKSQDTPLHDAILKNSVDVAEMLLDIPNIDTTLINDNKTTPLHYAAMLDRPELAELIAQRYPASILALARHEYTVLHIAAVNDHVKVLKVVLAVKDHGLCLDSKIELGLTALHLAAHEGYSESIEFLVSQGANINIQTDDGHSPLHLVASAVRSNRNKIKETLKLKEIQREYRDRGVADCAAALLCFMVLHGASIHTENVKCRTPLYYIDDSKLKKTLKQIARGERADDVRTREDVEEDEDAKMEWRNTIRDSEVIVERNDQVRHDPDSPKLWKHYKNELADNAIGSDHPSGNPTKPNRPQIEIFDLVHKIQVCDLDMGPVIGRGQFGAVHRAFWKGTPVAVKKISFIGSNKDEVEKEVSIHRQASHPNIVKIMALGYEEQEAFIVMQLIEGASLRTIIFPDRDDPKIPLEWPQKLQISREVLQAVTFMHASNILHLDIKPANILVEVATTRPFICDLGLAHIKSRNSMSQPTVNPKGTPSYMPPEVLCASGEPGYRHSKKHDIWSVGGTLVVLFSMKHLWGDSVHYMELLVRVAKGTMGKPEALTAVDPRVKKILEPCFNQNPEERPSASDLLNNFNDLS